MLCAPFHKEFGSVGRPAIAATADLQKKAEALMKNTTETIGIQQFKEHFLQQHTLKQAQRGVSSMSTSIIPYQRTVRNYFRLLAVSVYGPSQDIAQDNHQDPHPCRCRVVLDEQRLHGHGDRCHQLHCGAVNDHVPTSTSPPHLQFHEGDDQKWQK